MGKKLLLIMCVTLLAVAASYAQQRLTGRVIDKSTQEPLIGATVQEKGTNNAQMTDVNGAFMLTTSSRQVTLVVTYLGYISVEIAATTEEMLIEMAEDVQNIDEVVITALSVPKQKKMLGYSVQEIAGKNIAVSRESNPMSALVGKVAGMRVSIHSDMLKNPQISVRGVAPITVVDGVPVSSDTWNISPDDIEAITVLKGPTAAALYGSQGKNGAIQITTKSGAKNKGKAQVSFNSTTQFQTSYIAIPGVQNSYGPGYDYQYEFGDGLKGEIGGVNCSDSDVWGPRFEGQLLKQWNSPMDANGVRTPTPWLSIGAKNLENFMQTGIVATNNIAVAQQNDKGEFRVSVSDTYQRGLFPNTSLNSLNFNLNGGIKISPKVKVSASINYNSTDSDNYPDVEYNPRSPLYLLTLWTGAQIDVRQMKDYWVPGMEGLQQYNYDYAQYNNPWFMAYENLRGHHRKDVHGQVVLSWRITPDFDFRARTNLSTNTLFRNEKYPVSGSVYDGAYKWVGGYEESYNSYTDLNSDFMFNYAAPLSGSFGLKASVGGAYRVEKGNYSWAGTLGGLIVPGIYTLQNSKESRPGRSNRWEKEVGSLYGYVDMDYKNKLFLSVTGRVDHSSTLPLNNNTYFYPSVSLSAMISDMVKLPEFISYLRLRTSYANVGGDLGVYELMNTYKNGGIWDGQTSLVMDGQLLDPNIKPEFSSTLEFGADVRFFNNRLGFDFTYFLAEDGPQIFSLQTPPSSGYDSHKVNGLTYTRRGFELAVNATPVVNKNFEWNITGNISQYRRYLKSVYGDVDNLGFVKVGERVDQLWVNDFMRSADGKVIYKDGMPQRDPIKKFWGNYDPDFIFGLQNRFRYKDFELNIGIDGSIGGKISNSTWENLWRSGRHELSDNEWRLADWEAYKKDPSGFGTTYKGVFVGQGVVVTGGELKRNPDGSVISDTRTYAENTTPVLYQNWAGSSRGFYRTESQYIQNRTYLKLREVTLTYNIPQALIKKTGFLTSARVSFVGRNLLYLTKADYIDLDQFTGGGTVLQTPSTRNFGFNINLTF